MNLSYLGPENQLHRFDQMLAELDIQPQHFPIEEISSLTGFISREKSLYQQDFLVFDLCGAEYTNDHVIAAVQMARRFCRAKLIFFAPDHSQTKALFQTLAGVWQVYDLLTVTEELDWEAALKKCLLQEERDYHQCFAAMAEGVTDQVAQTVRDLTIPAGLVLKLAVAGTMPRIGVTTQTFALWHYVKELGFSPAILDSAGEMTRLLAGCYGVCAAEEGVTEINGIVFCTRVCPEYDCYLIDCGVLRPECLPAFLDADLRVLVTGIKPWELTRLPEAVGLLPPGVQGVTLVSFSGGAEPDALEGLALGVAANAPYHPDLFQPGSSKYAYQQTVLPELKRLCGENNGKNGSSGGSYA